MEGGGAAAPTTGPGKTDSGTGCDRHPSPSLTALSPPAFSWHRDPEVRRWGQISAEVKRASRHAPPVIDTMLAAAAIEHGLYLVTRNVKDTKSPGAMVFDLWNDDA